jgi:transcription factor C subunit 6
MADVGAVFPPGWLVTSILPAMIYTENVLQETQDRPSATRAKSKNPNVQVNPIGTGAWSPEVGVHRVVWNNGNGLSNAHLLASATGSGLCRIDWLTGRWMKDKVPYYDVEKIRGDIEAELDMDEEEESD